MCTFITPFLCFRGFFFFWKSSFYVWLYFKRGFWLTKENSKMFSNFINCSFQIVQVNFLDLNCSFKLPWLSPSVKNRIWRIVNTQLWQLARHLEHAIHHNTARLLQSYILMSFYLWDFKLLNSCLCIITCSWILMLNRSRNFTVILKLRVPNDELIVIIRYWQFFKCVFLC